MRQFIYLSIAAVCVAAGSAASAQDIQERTIKFGHLNNTDHPVSLGVKRFAELDVTLETIQSNHEGDLIDFLHQHIDTAQGALVNPAGLTQHGVPLHDAIKAMPFPMLEIHMSNIAAREPRRSHSIISPAVKATIQGLGPLSYLMGLRGVVELVRQSSTA